MRHRDALKARLTQLSVNTRAQQRGMCLAAALLRLLRRRDDGKRVGREQNAFPSNRNSVLKWSKRNATEGTDKAKADCGWSQVTSFYLITTGSTFSPRQKFRTVFSVFQYLQPLAGPPTTSTITHRVQSCVRGLWCLALIFRFQVQPRIGSDFLLR